MEGVKPIPPESILLGYERSLVSENEPFIKAVSNKKYDKTAYTRIQVLHCKDEKKQIYAYATPVISVNFKTYSHMLKSDSVVKVPQFSFAIDENTENLTEKVILLLEREIYNNMTSLYHAIDKEVPRQLPLNTFIQKKTNTGSPLSPFICRIKLRYGDDKTGAVSLDNSEPRIKEPFININKTIKKNGKYIYAYFTQEELMYKNINKTIPYGSIVITKLSIDTICKYSGGYSIQVGFVGGIAINTRVTGNNSLEDVDPSVLGNLKFLNDEEEEEHNESNDGNNSEEEFTTLDSLHV